MRITTSVTLFCKREKSMQPSPITKERCQLFRRIPTFRSVSVMLFGKKEKPKKQSIITGKHWNYVLTTSARIIILAPSFCRKGKSTMQSCMVKSP